MSQFLTLRHKFEFDLNGFVVIKNFLSKEKVKQINDIIDATPEGKNSHKFPFMTKSEIFLDLMEDQRLLEVAHSWIDPHFRFDHAWGVQHHPSEANLARWENIHGGPFQEQKFFQYHWHNGSPTCTCILMTIVLEPQKENDGGFVLVPGSHKSNLGLPGFEIFQQVMGGKFGDETWLHQPVVDAGDLLIFTEATMHGTKVWKPESRRRRNLYYKYSYGSMSWPTTDLEERKELLSMAKNEQQRLLLRAPFVSETAGNELTWRRPTWIHPVSVAQKAKQFVRSGVGKLKKKAG